jgi:hypothetical protein
MRAAEVPPGICFSLGGGLLKGESDGSRAALWAKRTPALPSGARDAPAPRGVSKGGMRAACGSIECSSRGVFVITTPAIRFCVPTPRHVRPKGPTPFNKRSRARRRPRGPLWPPVHPAPSAARLERLGFADHGLAGVGLASRTESASITVCYAPSCGRRGRSPSGAPPPPPHGTVEVHVGQHEGAAKQLGELGGAPLAKAPGSRRCPGGAGLHGIPGRVPGPRRGPTVHRHPREPPRILRAARAWRLTSTQ